MSDLADDLEPCQKCGESYELRGEPSKYCDPCAQEALIEVEAERDALKSRLEAIKPTPSANSWLRDQLNTHRMWAAQNADDPYPFTVAIRDWLETILGESPESDPWKDRRGK